MIIRPQIELRFNSNYIRFYCRIEDFGTNIRKSYTSLFVALQ